MDTDQVLALYGFRSKQEFIYRTNRMKEITGASELIATMFRDFLEQCDLPIKATWENEPWQGIPEGMVGAVVYEGGGNLCLLLENADTYKQINRAFSLYTLRKAPNLGLIAANVRWTGDFKADIKNLHAEHDRAKRMGANTEMCNALPFSKIVRKTFQPAVSVDEKKGDLSTESVAKLKAYNRKAQDNAAWADEGKNIDDLAWEKGKDSLIAVMYCDGNSIGQRLKDVSSIEGMREFSVEVHKALVEGPLDAVQKALSALPDEKFRHFRTIIDHGDEITLIMNAHAVPAALKAYFEAIESTGSYHACAGVAVCHPHDPFSEVYKIAEECCESAKTKNRKNVLAGQGEGSYVDFHFCRSGITGTLEQIRGAQEQSYTLRPYAYKGGEGVDFVTFMQMGRALAASAIARGDIKNLGNLVLVGPAEDPSSGSRYKLEIERLKFKEGKDAQVIENLESSVGSGQVPKLIFDIAGFFDIWFDNASTQTVLEGGSNE